MVGKKTFFVFILASLFCGNVFSMGMMMDGFTGSTHSLQTFKNRMNEVEKDGTLPESLWARYVGSTHSLQTFKNRMNEVERDGTLPESLW